jgi:2-keto-4-pentenoate hydratase/2-oxohepta-3-ene-1,7-dioic acid hydratase in catechol pathway
MRIARLLHQGVERWAELSGGRAWWLDDAPWLGGARVGEHLDGVDAEGQCAEARRLAPVTPSKIVCIGRNYAAHAAELGNEVPEEPLLFLKPPSSLLAPDGTVELPPSSARVEHEVELGIVVGHALRDANEDEARAAIWGYTIVCDVTARDLQRSDKTWTRGKGFDTFCPAGPVVVRGIDDRALAIRCTVGGALRQHGTTAAMLVCPAGLLAYISGIMRLEPGDLIATGTPEGVGPLADGDRVTLSIDEIGTLSFDVGLRRARG